MSGPSHNPPKQYHDFAVQTEEFDTLVRAAKPSGHHIPIGSPSETSSPSSPSPANAPLGTTSSGRGSKRYDGLPLRRPGQERRITSMPTSGLTGDKPAARILSLPAPKQGGNSATQSPRPSDEYDSGDELDLCDQREDGAFANFRESILLGLPRTPSPRTPPDGQAVDFAYDPCFDTAYTHPDGAWQGSPPRPIPALHGPLSLPYARCPSGAEGTVVDGDNLSHKVWGLGNDDHSTPREYLSPEITTPTWSSQEYNISWQLITMNQPPRDLAPLAFPGRLIHTPSRGIPNRPVHVASTPVQSIQSLSQAPTNYSRPVGLSSVRQETIGPRRRIEDPLSLGVGDLHSSMRQLQTAHPLSHRPISTGPLGILGSEAFTSPELSPLNFGYKLESVPPAFRQPRPQEHVPSSRRLTTPLNPSTRAASAGWPSSVASWSPDLPPDEVYQSLLPHHAHMKPALLETEHRSPDLGLDYGLRPDIATAIVRSKTQSEFVKNPLSDTTLPTKPRNQPVHSTSGDQYIGAKQFDTRHPREEVGPPGSHNMLAPARTSFSSGMIQAPRSVPLARLVQRRLSSVPEEGKAAFGVEPADPHESRNDIVGGNQRKALDWGWNRSSQKENTTAANDQACNSGVRGAPKSTSRPVQRRNRPARATPYKKRYSADQLDGNGDVDDM